MKKRIFSILLTIMLLVPLCACGAKEEQPFTTQFSHSYLTDADAREEIAAALSSAGVSQKRQEVFFTHVDQMGGVLGEQFYTKGFESVKAEALPEYDPYALQDAWYAAYPDFFGYNCRISAYLLFGDFLQIEESSEKRDLFLAMDLAALEQDSSALEAGGSAEAFSALFSTIPAKDTSEVLVHVKTVQEDWKKRGITFLPSDKISLITVFFHDKLSDTEIELFIGHAGVLIELGDKLYFIEKVAFEEPYQALCFGSRTELSDYLMGKYDYGDGETARPFIMENDRLMEGYRKKPA